MYRILSLDGGGQLELTSTLLLQEIEMRRPGFLANTDILAGTSAGGMVALILATEADPARLLPETDELWEKFDDLTMNWPGLMFGLFGVSALFTHDRLAQYLEREELLGNKTLADLEKEVIITSFQLDHVHSKSGARQWRPKIFHNFGRPNNPDLQERAVDVALRSGAAPIFFPVVDGYIDGGVFANHPAMVAVAEICHDLRRHPDKETPAEGRQLEELRLLSIGVGEDQRYLDVKTVNWGWFQWLLNPFDPLLAINALLRGDQWAINFQCKNMMPEGNYYRLNPFYSRHSTIPMYVNTEVIRQTVQSEETQEMIDETVKWLDKSGWLD